MTVTCDTGGNLPNEGKRVPNISKNNSFSSISTLGSEKMVWCEFWEREFKTMN